MVDGGINPKRQRLQEGAYADIDKVIFKWLLTVRSRNVPVLTDALKEKALYFARELNVENFSASDRWVNRWKTRFHISMKKVSDAGNACNSDMTAPWTETTLPTILSSYQLEQNTMQMSLGCFTKPTQISLSTLNLKVV